MRSSITDPKQWGSCFQGTHKRTPQFIETDKYIRVSRCYSETSSSLSNWTELFRIYRPAAALGEPVLPGVGKTCGISVERGCLSVIASALPDDSTVVPVCVALYRIQNLTTIANPTKEQHGSSPGG